MFNLIEKYINNMTKQDIMNFANKQNLKYSESEIDFVYNFIKNNYKNILNDPSKFNLEVYKDKFSSENFNYLTLLYNRYKHFLIR